MDSMNVSEMSVDNRSSVQSNSGSGQVGLKLPFLIGEKAPHFIFQFLLFLSFDLYIYCISNSELGKNWQLNQFIGLLKFCRCSWWDCFRQNNCLQYDHFTASRSARCSHPSSIYIYIYSESLFLSIFWLENLLLNFRKKLSQLNFRA